MLNAIYHLCVKTKEYLYLIGLDAASVPVGIFEVSHGGIDSSFSNPREIFQRLLFCNAASFVLAHNHPSGSVRPSISDLDNFKRIHEASKIMGVSMVDFMIIGSLGCYHSFNENHYIGGNEMGKYKVEFSGFAYIDASSPLEAEELFHDGDTVYSEHSVTGVEEVDDFLIDLD